MKQRQLTILGSGSSLGTPVMGCDCAACRSKDEKDQRTRCAALLDWDGKKLLIDAGPDIRLQGVRAGIESIDGLILTHAHSDHTAGLADLRMLVFKEKKPIQTLCSPETHKEFLKRFDYLERFFSFTLFPAKEGTIDFLGLPIQYISYEQDGMDVKGLRFQNFAYITDIKSYNDHHIKSLQGIDSLVVSGASEAPTNVHMSIYESVEFAQKTGAKRAWFTHVSHDLLHSRGNAITPEHMHMAYDGLEIEI